MRWLHNIHDSPRIPISIESILSSATQVGAGTGAGRATAQSLPQHATKGGARHGGAPCRSRQQVQRADECKTHPRAVGGAAFANICTAGLGVCHPYVSVFEQPCHTTHVSLPLLAVAALGGYYQPACHCQPAELNDIALLRRNLSSVLHPS